jgi:OFA family oxalate/formate antiporter-like MFS transporter
MGSALKWFTDRRGLAAGVIAGGYGGGAALFTPMIAWVLAHYGYKQAFLWTGLFQGGVILIVAQFLRHPPADPAPVATAGAVSAGKHQFTTLEVLRTPRFYQMYLMFILMATGGLLVTANAGPMARSWGLSAAALTWAATLSPVANGAARVTWGWASDRLGRENTMILTFVLQAIALFLVVAVGQTSAVMFSTTLVLVYFTWGQIYSLFPATSADYFGTRHATSNYAVLYSAKGTASIFGGWVATMLYERTGSWATGFYISAVMALLAAVMALGLKAARRSELSAGVAVPAVAK